MSNLASTRRRCFGIFRKSTTNEYFSINFFKRTFFLMTTILPILTSDGANFENTAERSEENELGDLLDILRGNSVLNSAEGSVWSETVDTWISEIDNGNLGKYGQASVSKNQEVTTGSLWHIWNNLPTITRDIIIKKLYPILVPGGSNSGGENWRLHCSDAYKLCVADSNCYWKYRNYVSSCTNKDFQNWEEVDDKYSSGNEEGWRRRDEDVTIYRNLLARNRRRRSGSKRVKKRSHVYEVQKRTKVRTLKRRHSQKHKSVLWMGKTVSVGRREEKESFLNYFSMKSRSNKCSSNCVDSLIMLNKTVYGALLAHCDCRAKTLPLAYLNLGNIVPKKNMGIRDEEVKENDSGGNWDEGTCMLHQSIAQSCRPRLFHESDGVLGCTESRTRCQNDPACFHAQKQFLKHCSQVISGVHCTEPCAESVRQLRRVSPSYETCVCDSREGPICRQIRSNVVRLCDIKDIPFQDTEEFKYTLQPSNGMESHTSNSSKYVLSRTRNLNEEANSPGGGSPKYFSLTQNFIMVAFMLLAQLYITIFISSDT